MAGGAVGGAAGAAAAAAAIAQAIKASGAIVRVVPEEFHKLLDRHPEPLVVVAPGGFWSAAYHYLMGYKGLVFHTRSRTELELPSRCEVIRADKIWIPG